MGLTKRASNACAAEFDENLDQRRYLASPVSQPQPVSDLVGNQILDADNTDRRLVVPAGRPDLHGNHICFD